MPIHCYRREGHEYFKVPRETMTDADGRYCIAAPPGVVKIVPAGLPQANLVAKQRETPDLDLTTDREWPDMTLARGAEVDGIVVDETGQPVVGAEVYLLDGGPRRQEEIIRTGAGGRFHFDQLDPDAMISLWARSKIATTNGAMLSRPGNRPGRLTLTIDPRFAAQIRGMAVDETGKRVRGPTSSYGGRGPTPVRAGKPSCVPSRS